LWAEAVEVVAHLLAVEVAVVLQQEQLLWVSVHKLLLLEQVAQVEQTLEYLV
jgi:hypothetical protein